ncbi:MULTISPECIES: hypothetical protein [Pseudanabaena]|uniref:Uncharacterized protein n=2 Tax=Pseudanabaena TaxID=1152 RepID=L8MXR4_9CYAN|nr:MULTISPECIES: hypothetical protein [Pseudanabaena]ELS32787.1 hypothetical protein Pse7429DRAFT_1992 [Pseudanabaena biceps PCC 7429]MDG3494973.1 hypothetical protein [Pseudanabaena catenata USMAC16]
MTAFSTSDLPTGDRACTTVEQVVAWGTEVLRVNNPTEKFVRVAGNPAENRVQFGNGVDSDNTQNVQCVCVFKEDPTTVGLSLPAWKTVAALNSAPIPTALK